MSTWTGVRVQIVPLGHVVQAPWGTAAVDDDMPILSEGVLYATEASYPELIKTICEFGMVGSRHLH